MKEEIYILYSFVAAHSLQLFLLGFLKDIFSPFWWPIGFICEIVVSSWLISRMLVISICFPPNFFYNGVISLTYKIFICFWFPDDIGFLGLYFSSLSSSVVDLLLFSSDVFSWLILRQGFFSISLISGRSSGLTFKIL